MNDSSPSALQRVAANTDLRRLELSFLSFSFAEHATWLAVLVFALDVGDTRKVGLVAAVMLAPGIVLAPFAAYAGDRFAPQRALAIGYAAQSLTMLATAWAMMSDHQLLAYVAATLSATSVTFTRPVMRAFIPDVTRTPADLVAANAVTSGIEQLGLFGGPLVAGLLMNRWAPWSVFALCGGLMALAAATTARVASTAEPVPQLAVDAGVVWSQVLGGFRTLGREGRVRALVWIGGCAGLVKGVADVGMVAFPAARLSGAGGAAGALGAAHGIGALLGAAAVTRLPRSGRVSTPLLACGVLVFAAFAVLAPSHSYLPAMLAFAGIGAADALIDLISSITIQRQAQTAVLARVFGIVEALLMATTAVGALGAALLFGALTTSGAVLTMGAVLLVCTALCVWRLRHHGDEIPAVDEDVLSRLVADELLGQLPAPTIERLARTAGTRSFGVGTPIITKGEPGDVYYLVRDGATEVTIDGEHIRFVGTGGSFGDVALLRDVPRTATVTALSAVDTLTVDRADFLEAVTGHPRTLGHAQAVIDTLEF